MTSVEMGTSALFSKSADSGRGFSRLTLTALIVEDSDVVGHLLRVLLETDGFEVTIVSNGAEALERARTLQPNIVLLDLALPGLHGRDVLHALKEHPSTQNIPVLVISAFPDILAPADRELAASILAKPFDVDELLSAVRKASRSPRSP